jgi:hypothetical protein
MEGLFSPCNRLCDRLKSQGRLGEFRDRIELLRELNMDVSTKDFLSAERAFTYADLYAMLGNGHTVAWLTLTPHAAVTREGGSVLESWLYLDELHRFYFNADGKGIHVLARSPDHLLEICDVVLRLSAASVLHSVILRKWSARYDYALINTPTLAYLMDQCQSLKSLTLARMALDEDHLSVLGVDSRPDLEIKLIYCVIARAAAAVLARVLGRNEGPTRLDACGIDYFVLADGLRGNSRLKSLTLLVSVKRDVGNRQVLAIAGALRENRDLVELKLLYDLRTRTATKRGASSVITFVHVRATKRGASSVILSRRIRHSRF